MFLPVLKADYLYLLVPLAALSPMLGTIEHLEAVSRGFVRDILSCTNLLSRQPYCFSPLE